MSTEAMRLGLLYSSFGRRVDGVADYAGRLREALADDDRVAEALVADRLGERWRVTGRSAPVDRRTAVHAIESCDWVIVQYSPFAHGRWGLAPWLLALTRHLQRRVRIAVMVHEPFLVRTGVRDAPISVLQRQQLRLLLHGAGVAFASIEPWVPVVRRISGRTLVHHLPVSSNLPPARLDRAEARERLGINDGLAVLATLSSGHDSRCDGHVVAAANAVAVRRGRVALLDLGGGARGFTGLARTVEVRRPGFLPAGALADHLAAADVYLAPLADGVSTRRTSVMAALQAGVAVVGTRGHLTDPQLQAAPDALVLVDIAAGPTPYADAVAAVLDEDAGRAAGRAGAALWTKHFGWDKVADKLMSALTVAAVGDAPDA